MYGWINLEDVVTEQQAIELSNIADLLLSQDEESVQLGVQLFINSDFKNLEHASVNCGNLNIRYNIHNKSYILSQNWHISDRIYAFWYVKDCIESFYSYQDYFPKIHPIRNLIIYLAIQIKKSLS